MSLDALFKLDPTSAVSNSNYAGANIAEGCAPSGINNALRALGQMVAQQLCCQSAAISASVSTNIATVSTGLYMGILGTGAINSFGTVPGEQPSAAVLRLLEFSSSASLSHGGSIFLQGGQSRRTQPGDVGMYIHEGPGDQWRELFYSQASGSPLAGSISLSTVNAIVSNFNSTSASVVNATSLSVSVMTVGGVQEFPRTTFLAHKNGTGQTISASQVLITFGTEDWDVGAAFASSTYTPPSGKHRLSVQLDITAGTPGTGSFSLFLMKNGSTHRRQALIPVPASESQFIKNMTVIVDANGTDTFNFEASTTAGNCLISGLASGTFFCGERV